MARKQIALWLALSFAVVSPARAQLAPDSSTPSIQALAADTTQTTVLGNTFVAPMGWRVKRGGEALVVEAP
jgi:hypothetical protein